MHDQSHEIAAQDKKAKNSILTDDHPAVHMLVNYKKRQNGSEGSKHRFPLMRALRCAKKNGSPSLGAVWVRGCEPIQTWRLFSCVGTGFGS